VRSDLRAALVCAQCRHALTWSERACVCVSCQTAYPIEGGIPNLLPPAAARSLQDDGARAENARLRAELGRHVWLRWIIDVIRPPLPYDRHGRFAGQRVFDAAIPRQPGREPLVLDLGAGEGGDDQLAGLCDATRANLVQSDMRSGARVDFISDAHRIPLANDALDGVVFQGVAEHVARPWLIAAEIVRVLKPGGVVYCEAPFIQWYHEDPKDYYRFTEDGLRALFDGCTCLDSGVAIGPVGGVVGVARELVPMLFTSPYFYWPLKWVLAWLTYPLVLLDRLYRRRPRGKTVALGVYLVARKPLGRPA
jgi:uncharacterized protein YbaR (Trm112 family)/SAM-dependent methyltransferase